MKTTCVFVLTLFVKLGSVISAQCPDFDEGVKTGLLGPEELTEASGLVASRGSTGLLWIHNDSGDRARVFGVDTHGVRRVECRLLGANHVDYEDIATGPGTDEKESYLYVGDIGDNRAVRPFVSIYRFIEPDVPRGLPNPVLDTPCDRIDVVFEDGPRDAETLLIDPLSRTMVIISKRDNPSRIYETEIPLDLGGNPLVLRYVGDLPFSWAVGGDVSPQGDGVIVRGYNTARFWPRRPKVSLGLTLMQPGCVIPLRNEPQGEAIAFGNDTCHYFTVSEQAHQPLFCFSEKGRCQHAIEDADQHGKGGLSIEDQR